MSLTVLKQDNSLSRDILHDYQRNAVDFIKSTPCCALWVDMGLGKTVSTLTALADLFDTFVIGRVLVIAPLRVAKHTWPAEIANWQHTRHLTFDVVTGNPQQRLDKLKAPADIHLINVELVVWLVKKLGKDWPYDTVIIDESSGFKSSKSQRFKALKKVAPKIDRMVQLTGTPASNGLLDLWAQMFLLDGGERLGKTFSSFRNKYFTSDYMGYKFTPKPEAESEIYDKLADICLSLAAEDYLKMPERVDNIIRVTLNSRAAKQYAELEREFLLELEQDKVEVFNAAALTNKLLQFTNGAVYVGDQGEFEEVHDAKLDALEEVINEAAGQPVLVAYNFKSDLVRIRKRFKNAEGISDSDEVIERWNAGKVPILLAHPASAGHGLNLQHGGNVVVWFGLNWSLELYQQFNARLYRQGQEKPVIIHHIVVDESVDTSVMAALENKNTNQKALLNGVKRDIKNKLRGARR